VASSFEVHRERRGLFGSDVDSYDDGRPGYPDEVYLRLVDVCGLGGGSKVLEIGPGTGQATRCLLDRGASVVAVELSEALGARLSAKYEGRRLEVVVGAFESVELGESVFDIVASATAFHWVPPESGMTRSATLLRPGGWLALWWNVFGDPDRPDPFHDALVLVLSRLAPQLLDVPGAGNAVTGAHSYAMDADARIAEIVSTRRFGPPVHEVIRWTGRHSALQIRTLFASFSPWLALEPILRSRVLDALEALARNDFGGIVERPYLTPIYLAQRDG
jgi:SAM-dependent methyltransferase